MTFLPLEFLAVHSDLDKKLNEIDRRLNTLEQRADTRSPYRVETPTIFGPEA